MREYVYLFKLDSVRKTDDEIAAGQEALYNEIVSNGNIVVMTYNQLVDSRGFFSLFGDKTYQKSLIRLFKNGAIRISQYGDVRSLSKYLINSVSSDKKFIYSALPVKYSQKHLLALIKRSLMYSDLSEIYEYCHEDQFNMIVDMLPMTIIPATIVPAMETILFLFVTEFLTSAISYVWPEFMSLSDALSAIKTLVADRMHIWSKQAEVYVNSCGEALDVTEKESKDRTIEFMLSPEMKRYLQFRNDPKNKKLFVKSDVYPIAKIDSAEAKKKLTHLEEKFDYHFGLVYQSKYNTLLVDPIEAVKREKTEQTKPSYFPYERIVPSSGKDGVVMLTKCKGNFILLKQYRHAPRQEQYSFPRGFAEPEYTPAENACRELKEELQAIITKPPVLLGRVISDSGLTSTKVYIFAVEIDSYTFDATIHEGIEEIIEVPEKEMDSWIKNNRITDGFSLSAYALNQ